MKKSFTLIELLLVIAIMLILGGAAAPFFARFLTQNNVINVSDQLTGQMRKAQIYAMMGKKNGSWGVTVGGSAITLFQGTSFALRNPSFDEKINLNPIIIVSGLSEVVFTKITGLPSATPTINISANNTTANLVINNQGVVSKQ